MKILCVKVSFKITPNARWLFGLLENITFQVKIAVVVTVWATFRKIGLPFIPTSGRTVHDGIHCKSTK